MPAVSANINVKSVENFIRNIGHLAIAIEDHVQNRERQAILRIARQVFISRIDVIDPKAQERVYFARGGGALILLLNRVYIRHIRDDVSEGPARDRRGGPVVSRIKGGTIKRSFFLKRGRSHGKSFDIGRSLPVQRLGQSANPITTGGPDLTHPIPNRHAFAEDVLRAIAASPNVRVSIRRGFAQVFSNA